MEFVEVNHHKNILNLLNFKINLFSDYRNNPDERSIIVVTMMNGV